MADSSKDERQAGRIQNEPWLKHTRPICQQGSAQPDHHRDGVLRWSDARRLLLLALGILLFILAISANYGPLASYLDAQSRLDKADAGIAELAAQKADLQAELGRLSQADYLESLAREDLSYARPGEELYIVTEAENGIGSETVPIVDESSQSDGTVQGATTGGLDGPGFLQRVLMPILDVP